MKHLTRLTFLTVLATGLAAVLLASVEPGHAGGPHLEHQSPHTKRSIPRPPEVRKHKAEPPMKEPLKHVAKRMPEHHRYHHGR